MSVAWKTQSGRLKIEIMRCNFASSSILDLKTICLKICNAGVFCEFLKQELEVYKRPNQNGKLRKSRKDVIL